MILQYIVKGEKKQKQRNLIKTTRNHTYKKRKSLFP